AINSHHRLIKKEKKTTDDLPRCGRPPAFSRAALRLCPRPSCFAGRRRPHRRWHCKKHPRLDHLAPCPISSHHRSPKKTPSPVAPPPAFSRVALRLRPRASYFARRRPRGRQSTIGGSQHPSVKIIVVPFNSSSVPLLDLSAPRPPPISPLPAPWMQLASRMDQGALSSPVFPIPVLPPLSSPMDGVRSIIHVRRSLEKHTLAAVLWRNTNGRWHYRNPVSQHSLLSTKGHEMVGFASTRMEGLCASPCPRGHHAEVTLGSRPKGKPAAGAHLGHEEKKSSV
ncbi:unnamed protein product, partial [Urochloa humidicola]